MTVHISRPPLARSLAALAALLLLVGLSPPTLARTEPGRVAVHTITVIDDAHMLTKQTVRELLTRSARINGRVHETVWVITVPSFQGKAMGRIAERYTGTRPMGITIVVSRDDRRVGMAVNTNQWRIVDLTRVKTIIEKGVREGRPDQGLLQGVRLLEQTL